MKYAIRRIFAICCACAAFSASGAVELVPTGSVWKFLDDGSDQGIAWRAAGFDDSTWSSGAAQLGYGDGDELTVLDASGITYYFRHSFTLPDAQFVESATLDLLYDDGAIVYLNGEEVHRTALMPETEGVPYDEPTLGFAPDNSVDADIAVPTSLLVDGANVFAVEVHNHSADSSDISFDFSFAVDGSHFQPFAAAKQIRLVWVDDPATTMTVGWTHGGGVNGTVHYGTSDEGRDVAAYPLIASVERTASYGGGGIVSQFARLTGLTPDTEYFFVVSDNSGVSPRYRFRTAPDTPRAFSFIAGGDSRNNRVPRQKANRMVSKLRPLFVAFTGDMIDNDNATEWDEWLTDWQLTVSDDGRMYPILPHRGNHESRGNSTIDALFDTTADNYYGLTFGGGLLRYYVLNSEFAEHAQADWLQADLDASGGAGAFTHLVAGYHKPMRPHTSSKTEGTDEYEAWAQVFYDNRFDLVFESDSHVMKRTSPLRPSVESGHEEGFVVDPLEGTVYAGEGCWGAPLRSPDDDKFWTLDSGSFNGFDLVHVHREHMELYTVQVDAEADVAALPEVEETLALPAGIPLWEANGGAKLIISRITDVPQSYSSFQMEAFPGSELPAGVGVHEDFDGDGVDNYHEFAFVLDPAAADSLATTRFQLPHLTVDPEGTKGVAFRRRTGSTLEYRVEFSGNLSMWETLVESVDFVLLSDPGTGFEDVTYELTGETADRDEAFFRVIAEE